MAERGHKKPVTQPFCNVVIITNLLLSVNIRYFAIKDEGMHLPETLGLGHGPGHALPGGGGLGLCIGQFRRRQGMKLIVD